MLRFKQFLVEFAPPRQVPLPQPTVPQSAAEIDALSTTAREHLIKIYGKENFEKLMKSIKDRESAKGGLETYVDSQKSKAQLFHTPTQEMFKNFSVPTYTDANLDRLIDFEVKQLSPNEKLISSGAINTVPAAQTVTRQYNSNYPYISRIEVDANYMSPKDVQSQITKPTVATDEGRTISHEITHTLSTNLGYQGKRNFPLVDDNTSQQEFDRKQYTQNLAEPAARMSELKQAYYQQTGNMLTANMTADDLKKFNKWYKDKFLHRDHYYKDTMELINLTGAGEELFRRTVKNDQNNKNLGQSQIA